MKKGDKKGQSLSMNTIIITVLAILVLVLVAGVSFGFFDLFDRGLGLAPSQLETFKQACTTYASSNLKVDYCNTFREAENEAGKKMYVNCLYDEIDNVLEEDAKLDCGDSVTADSTAEAYCEKLRDDGVNGFESRIVNGQTCEERSVVVEEDDNDANNQPDSEGSIIG